MERQPLVGIVIVNYGRWHDTMVCLESVLRSTHANCHIVLCDNGSPDDSREQLLAWARGELAADPSGDLPATLGALVATPVEKPVPYVVLDGEEAAAERIVPPPKLTFIDIGANLGFAGANNIGIRHALAAGAKYVLLVNNDTVVAPDAVARIVAHAEADDALGLVGATILDFTEPHRVQAAAGGIFYWWNASAWMTQAGADCADPQAHARMDFVSGCFMLIRAAAARQVGLLDPRFFLYYEDGDYSIRMRRAGWRIGWAPDAALWHRGSATINRYGPRSDYHIATTALQFTWKHRPMLLPTVLAYSLYRWVAPKIVRRQWDRLEAVACAYRDFFTRGLRNANQPLIRR